MLIGQFHKQYMIATELLVKWTANRKSFVDCRIGLVPLSLNDTDLTQKDLTRGSAMRCNR